MPTDAALEGTFEVTLADGTSVEVRPVFDLLKQYLDDTFDLETTSRGHRAAGRRRSRASPRQLAENKRPHAPRRRHGPEPLLQQRPLRPHPLPRRGAHRQRRPPHRQRRQLRRQLPRLAVPGDAAVDHRGPVRHRARPHQAGAREEVLQGRVGPLLELRRAPAEDGRQDRHRRDAHADADEARSGSATRTRCSATPSGRSTSSRTRCRRPGGRVLQRVVLDELVRVRRHGLPGRLVGGAQAAGHDRELHQPVPARLPADAARAHPRHAQRLRGARAASRSARRDRSASPRHGRLLEGRARRRPHAVPAAGAERLEHDARLQVRRPPRELRRRASRS